MTFFQEYLRCKTVHPQPDYSGTLDVLERYAKMFGFQYERLEYLPQKPMLILTVAGTRPELRSIMLNSHTDVVPVETSKWEVPAFDAYKNEHGDVFARGAQDDKCIGVQYMEAIYRLVQKGHKFKRTVYLTYLPGML